MDINHFIKALTFFSLDIFTNKKNRVIIHNKKKFYDNWRNSL